MASDLSNATAEVWTYPDLQLALTKGLVSGEWTRVELDDG